MITIREVASSAGVSPATVSKVINQRPDVGPEAIARVEQAVKALGYSPRNSGRPGGKAARENRTNRIGLLIPGLPEAQVNSPVYMGVQHGVEEAARQGGRSLLLNRLPTRSGSVTELFPSRMDGVVLFGATRNNQLKAKLRKIPCIQVMGGVEEHEPWDHVSYSNAQIGRLAAEHLLGRGHRHTALLSGSVDGHFGERQRSFREAIEGAGGTCLELVDKKLILEGGAVQEVNRRVLAPLFDALLRAEPRPRALFMTADIFAAAAFGELLRRGLTPMTDLDLIACNNERLLLASLYPAPATIDIHAREVGTRAVEQLLWRIDHPEEEKVVSLLTPTLVPGEE